MHIKNLNTIAFDTIVNCFLQAFENYYVEFPKDKDYFKQRWEMSNIDYALSYGMFDEDQLVGFILHGIEERDNHLTAFNLATGVLPNYRGKKITKSIYEFAINDLIEKGISKCQLEVITKNTFAIKAYQSIGFNITKKYKCFAGKINSNNQHHFDLKETSIQNLKFNQISNQKLYSWENQIESVRRGNFKAYQVMNGSAIESFFIINKVNGYIPQFEVIIDVDETWNRLFLAIKSISETIKINNVDERLERKIYWLEKFNLKNTIDQYEMELWLN
ncbi:ribosomal protein S18 acetylase RimI-like enzyme [Flavobacteriaceae bacterium MAR_2010_72]|nr:ribosomal protein S18 acetylase RimI-like enzyme [Flavobacteriaceae bacterium MAR_2010_72]TVZ57644.1 ribosomal protein S18 acetylase RimI-like enzyme [Flavobacteriaceae bacterium MAR_2010_105]